MSASAVLAGGAWSGSYDNWMVQHAVGHGGFFTQSVTFVSYSPMAVSDKEPTASLEVVYDCGSGRGKNPDQSVVAAIDRHVLHLSEMRRNIDLLVVSHFDSDHINGLPHLAQVLKQSSLEVKRVWAPLLDPITRLVVALSGPPELENLVLSPESLFPELFSGTALELIPPAEPLPPPTRPPAREADTDAGAAPLEVKGPRQGRGLVAVEVGNTGDEVWELRPYTTPATAQAAAAISWALSQLIGKAPSDITVDDLQKHVLAPPALRKKFHGAVKARMAKAARGKGGATPSNHSSLCAWSGPTQPHTWCRNRMATSAPWSLPIAPGWIGTGDAVLITPQQVAALEHGFTAARTAHVGIMSAPHHGSKFDSSPDLWAAFPTLHVVTVEANSSTGQVGNRHPHQQVVSDIFAAGATPYFATRTAADFVWHDRRYR